MATTRKKKSPKQSDIPAHPRVPLPREIGELCADVYRYGIRITRQQGADEQTVEQLALGDVRDFMTACIKQSKADWKAYTRATGVHAAFVKAKTPGKKKTKGGKRA
jgi:hypothetical protein